MFVKALLATSALLYASAYASAEIPAHLLGNTLRYTQTPGVSTPASIYFATDGTIFLLAKYKKTNIGVRFGDQKTICTSFNDQEKGRYVLVEQRCGSFTLSGNELVLTTTIESKETVIGDPRNSGSHSSRHTSRFTITGDTCTGSSQMTGTLVDGRPDSASWTVSSCRLVRGRVH